MRTREDQSAVDPHADIDDAIQTALMWLGWAADSPAMTARALERQGFDRSISYLAVQAALVFLRLEKSDPPA